MATNNVNGVNIADDEQKLDANQNDEVNSEDIGIEINNNNNNDDNDDHVNTLLTSLKEQTQIAKDVADNHKKFMIE